METIFLFVIACSALPYALPVILFLVGAGLVLALIGLIIAFVVGMPYISIPLILLIAFAFGDEAKKEKKSDGSEVPSAA